MNGLNPDQIKLLIDKALEARKNAYAPYSGFNVGAALLSASGEIFIGCNVEISSYSLTCCAERNALYHAVASGSRDFMAIAIVANEDHCPPCGACRQVLADFNKEMRVILSDTMGNYKLLSLQDLLPNPFSLPQ